MQHTEPQQYSPETTTLWSFPQRGKWATHAPSYRGNCSPRVVRNLIEKYSAEGDLVVDPMVGGGTTLIEAKLLHRNAIGLDVNPDAVIRTNAALAFPFPSNGTQKVVCADARNMNFLKNDSVDFVNMHPPYLNIVKYSRGAIPSDLSNLDNPELFCNEIEMVARELIRVLKPGKHCAVLIGDTRRALHYIPLAYYVMQRFLKAGFALKEDIIKAQHNCTHAKAWQPRAQELNFYLIMHEHIFVFRKPHVHEDVSKIEWSMINS